MINTESEKPKNPKGKVEKCGADGLTKKERRALKIAAKDTQEAIIVEQACNQSAAPKQLINSTEKQSSIDKIKTRTISETVSEISGNITKENKSTAENIEGKSKAELRAQRRLLQEKQREAKKQIQPPSEQKPNKENLITKNKTPPSTPTTPKVRKEVIKKQTGTVELFNHLKRNLPSTQMVNNENIYPYFRALAAQYASYTILGSNARCLALLVALKQLINDFETPPNEDLYRSLERTLDLNVEYVYKYRPPAVSMTNALRHFKMQAQQIDPNLSDAQKKSIMSGNIANYVLEVIQKAGEAISESVFEKIASNDVILTFGCSSLITKILIDASKEKHFKVIIVDSRPLLEGRETLRRLIDAGIECVYVLIGAASCIMTQATKVLLGAHALLANGYVMSRLGTAQIALIAKAFNKPVLVCCETYKFSERVQTDSYVYNEIGNPNRIMKLSHTLKSDQYIKPMNLMYDITPPDFVTAVVTERGFLPCTSVPVILRIKPTE